MTESFDGQRAYDIVRHLTVEIGARVAGTEADRRATDYIKAYYSGLGLDVTEQTFDVPTGEILEHRVEILDPDLGEVAAWPELFSADTSAQGVMGELVFLEGAAPSDLGTHLQGKIILWYKGPLGSDGLRRLFSFRPAAVVYIGAGYGLQPLKHAISLERVGAPYADVPIFATSYAEGLRLVSAGARRARVTLRSERSQGISRNIIAQVRGRSHPEQIIVVGGHHDSVPGVPGATDDAAGTAVSMELARVFARNGSDRTLRFVAWGAEEVGLYGSRHYVGELVRRDREARAAPGFDACRDQSEWDRHLLAVGVDVAGMTLGYNICSPLAPTEMATSLRLLGSEIGIPHQVSATMVGGDILSFVFKGVPGVQFGREGDANHFVHFPSDSIDLIDGEHLRQTGAFIDAFLSRYAAAGRTWPFERKVPGDLAGQVEEAIRSMGLEF